MAFFDQNGTLQKLTPSLEALFNEKGWATTHRYRVVAPVIGDNYRKKFGEVTLFSSLGSDNQVRNFGMIHGYGGLTPTPLGQEPIISQNSELGLLGKGDGTKKIFNFPVKPVSPGSAYIYVGGVKVTTGFTLDEEKGTATFTTAPASGLEIRSTYALTDNAPEVPARLWFFTYEDLREEQIVTDRVVGKYTTAGTKTFSLGVGTNILKANTLSVSVGGTKITAFTLDASNGTITITGSYGEDLEVKATFMQTLVKDANGNFGDILVNDFDAHDPVKLANACYSGLNFIYPSLPTVVSFIPDDTYGHAWTRDSQMFYWGNITKDRIVMYFRPDAAPNPEGIYYAPLYIGRLSTIGKEPRKNNVLIGGGRVKDEVKFTPGMTLGGKLVDYGVNTSNGNSTVMLQQSVGGALYQKYYLAFITHDVDIDQSAEAKFNPSAYSGLYHISPMYIVHPSDGYVGRLDEVYAVHPKNISQLDELEVIEKSTDEELGIGDGVAKTFHFFHSPKEGTLKLKVNCTEITTGFTVDKINKTVTFDVPLDKGAELLADYDYKQVYRYTLADTPNTPFVLANTTPYAPIGLGMLKENF